MKFCDLQKTQPANMQRCVIKERIGKRTEVFGMSCLQTWWDDSRFACHPNVVAWAPVPEHVNVNPIGWLSEFSGNELPSKSCSCLVSTESSKIVRYAYYCTTKGGFLGYAFSDVLAFIII
jgi:hypothetical protein